jgi:hypothetical protein
MCMGRHAVYTIYILMVNGELSRLCAVCAVCERVLKREETETEIQQAKEKLRSDLLLNE